MRRPLKSVLVTALSIGLAFSACTDAPTAPAGPPEASEGLLTWVPANPVTVLKRTSPLEEDEEVTKVVGPAGATFTLPNAGFTLVIPSGALTESVEITVKAEAGNLVGYRFYPHGLQFRRSAIASQKTLGTELGLLGSLLSTPRAVYFRGELTPKVRALELLDLQLLPSLGLARFEIKHFSGYVIATD